jgi:SnoaL-like domain
MTTNDYAKLMDIENIKQLRVLYSHLLDSNDLDKLAALFTEDVVCDFGFGLWSGRDELRQNLANVHTQYDTNRTGSYPYMHTVTNHWIELTGPESAEGRCYLMCWVTAQIDRNPLLLLAVYADRYRKRENIWRIDRCRVDYIWPKRDVLGGMPGEHSNLSA